MHITPEHQELQEKYQKLVLRVYQHDQIVQAKDEAMEHLKSQITPLKTTNEEFTTLARQLLGADHLTARDHQGKRPAAAKAGID